jgi:hypothetical protein
VRVAALYDIHGNLPALTAVLAEVDALGVDAIVVGGDVASGPMPVETLDALRVRGALYTTWRPATAAIAATGYPKAADALTYLLPDAERPERISALIEGLP